MAAKKTNRSYQKSPIKSLKDISISDMLKDSGKPIGIMAGVLAGTPISMIIDKQMTGRRVLGMEGDKIKEWVKPCVKFILGMGAYKVTNSDMGKYIGIGLAANAGLTALENILGGKDFLQGGSDVDFTEYETIEIPEALESATPLDLPILNIEQPDVKASEVVDRILDENGEVEGLESIEGLEGIESIEGVESIEGTGEIDLGRNEEQIAGEIETLDIDSDMDMDDIP